MALIFEAFTDEELNIISGSSMAQDDNDFIPFLPQLGDYIRLSLYDEDNNFIKSFDSKIDVK